MPHEPSPKQQLDFFLGKFTPEIAALAKSVLAKMRKRLPGSNEFVYDNYYTLAIGFGPTERPSDAVFSIAVFPRWAILYFLHGAALPDPEGRLKGSGKVGRHVRIQDAAVLDDPVVRDLMDAALAIADPPLDPKQKGKILIRAVAEKQRSRQPAKRAAKY
jgi:hypothetical protein